MFVNNFSRMWFPDISLLGGNSFCMKSKKKKKKKKKKKILKITFLLNVITLLISTLHTGQLEEFLHQCKIHSRQLDGLLLQEHFQKHCLFGGDRQTTHRFRFLTPVHLFLNISKRFFFFLLLLSIIEIIMPSMSMHVI